MDANTQSNVDAISQGFLLLFQVYVVTTLVVEVLAYIRRRLTECPQGAPLIPEEQALFNGSDRKDPA